MAPLLLVAAFGFALLSGANDGATLGAAGARAGALSISASVGLLAVAVAVVPALVGTGVATTLAHGLVSFERSGGRVAFLAAVVAALLVVGVLSHRGLPTSATLALSGGIVGVGFGAGLPLHWTTVVVVVAAGLLGPLLASGAGFLTARSVGAAIGRPARPRAVSRLLRRAGPVVQSFAYGANGAEKMVAFAAVATGAGLDPVRVSLPDQLGIAGCFSAGALVTVRRVSTRVSEQMVRVRPEGAVSAAVASSALVLASAAVGLPMSSTQASTASLIGATARLSPHSVRGGELLSLGLAWGATLPVAVAGGAVLGLILRVAR